MSDDDCVMTGDQRRQSLYADLALAGQKQTASLAASLTSATFGAGLLAVGLIKLPTPCVPGWGGIEKTDGSCIPSDWNFIYCFIPLIAVLAAIVVLSTTSRFVALGVYMTDVERHINRCYPLMVSVTGSNGAAVNRRIPSSEQMLAGFVSRKGQRFSNRPLNFILSFACLAILIAGVCVPLTFIHSLNVKIAAGLVYAHVIFFVVRYLLATAVTARKYAQEMWSSGLAAAETSQARHGASGNGIGSSGNGLGTLAAFVIYPRPISEVGIKLFISAMGLVVVFLAQSSRPGSGFALVHGILMWAFIELVVYPIRYQINDIRDRVVDSQHPAATSRQRMKGVYWSDRSESVTFISFIYRILLSVAVGYLFGIRGCQWFYPAVFLVVFVVQSLVYERIKSEFKRNGELQRLTGNLMHARSLVIVCAFGYFWRTALVGVATMASIHDLRVLFTVLVVSCAVGVAEYSLLLNQWSLEGAAFVVGVSKSEHGRSRRNFFEFTTLSRELSSSPHKILALREGGLIPHGPWRFDENDQPGNQWAQLVSMRLGQLIVGNIVTLNHGIYLVCTVLSAAPLLFIGTFSCVALASFIVVALVFIGTDTLMDFWFASSARKMREIGDWPTFGIFPNRKIYWVLYRGTTIAVLTVFIIFLGVHRILEWSQAGFVIIPIALFFMIKGGENSSYAEQIKISQGIATMVPRARAKVRTWIKLLFGHDVVVSSTSGTATDLRSY